jgi:SAM-dependent methyltransferase
MHRQGLLTAQMNGEKLAFPDDSFDLVLCFDVLHHSDRPEQMAGEIVRVSRRHFLLCESNGLSPLRKLAELLPLARSLGERSYLPWRYRAFFPRDQVQAIEIRPFYVLVPPHAPEALIPLIASVSELGERLPGLRWIGQSLLIVGEKKQGS